MPNAEKDGTAVWPNDSEGHDVKFHVGTGTVVCTCGAYFESERFSVTLPRSAVSLWAEHTAESDARSEQVAIAARALHRHVCGTEWDEWNNPCSWAGEDAEPGLKSYPVCCEVDLSDLAGAVVDALSARDIPPADRHTCRHCGGPLGDAFDSDDHTCQTRPIPPGEDHTR